ncbi:hypothetical protein GEMRC1_003445 [Eukaryota sp. GEM-RC1]
MISSLVMSLDFSSDFEKSVDFSFLDPTSSFFLPQLKHLQIEVSSHAEWDSFYHVMSNNPTVEDLKIFLDYVEHFDPENLAEAVSSNSSLRRVSLGCSDRDFDANDAKFIVIIEALSTNASIKTVDLSKLEVTDDVIVTPLLNNSTIISLVFPALDLGSNVFTSLKHNLSLQSITIDQSRFNSNDLAEVLKFNTVLKKLELRECCCSLDPIFESLEFNTSLIEFCIIDDSKSLNNQEVQSLAEMFKRNSSLLFFRLPGTSLSYTDLVEILKGLEYNSGLQKFDLPSLEFTLSNFLDIFQILHFFRQTIMFDFRPDIIDFRNGFLCCSSPSYLEITSIDVSRLQSFLTGFDCRKLALNGCSFSDDSITALCDLLRVNNSLTSVDCSDCRLSDTSILSIVDAIQSNFTLKMVNLSNNHIQLTGMLTIFELISTGKLFSNILLSPHFLNVSTGYIRYLKSLKSSDMVSLLRSLKSNVAITRLDCESFEKLNLAGLMDLFEILSINKSLLDLDISPHLIDVENCVFCFSPERFTEITTEEVSCLKSFLEIFSIHHLALQKCFISTESVTNLCNIIKVNNSLTFLDFSDCRLSDHCLLKLIDSLQFNSSLKWVNLRNTQLSFTGIFKILELLSNHKLSPNLNISPHFINIEAGNLCFSPTSIHRVVAPELLLLQKYMHPSRIRELSFNRCLFSYESVVSLCDLIESSDSLTSLDLSECSITDIIFLDIIAVLQTKSHNLDLSFASNSITKKGVKALAEVLSVGLFLTKVNLTKNSIEDSGTIALAEVLRDNATIQELSLRKCGIGAEGILALGESFKSNSSLKMIDLQDNSIEPKVKSYIETIVGERIICLM